MSHIPFGIPTHSDVVKIGIPTHSDVVKISNFRMRRSYEDTLPQPRKEPENSEWRRSHEDTLPQPRKEPEETSPHLYRLIGTFLLDIN